MPTVLQFSKHVLLLAGIREGLDSQQGRRGPGTPGSTMCVRSGREEGGMLSQWEGYCKRRGKVGKSVRQLAMRREKRDIGWQTVEKGWGSAEDGGDRGRLAARENERRVKVTHSVSGSGQCHFAQGITKLVCLLNASRLEWSRNSSMLRSHFYNVLFALTHSELVLERPVAAKKLEHPAREPW